MKAKAATETEVTFDENPQTIHEHMTEAGLALVTKKSKPILITAKKWIQFIKLDCWLPDENR